LKQRQDDELPPTHAYIRFASELSSLESIVHEEDDAKGSETDPIRIVVCMSQESS
jgi:hypothetical protein